MLCVLLVASGAAWESAAFGLLNGRSDMLVLKRCVDVDDLLASAAAGQAHAAVVALDAPGLDGGAVDLLRRHRVRPVAGATGAVAEEVRLRAARIGVSALVDAGQLDTLAEAIAASSPEPGEGQPGVGLPGDGRPGDGLPGGAEPPVTDGRVIAVWGPQGAPGRTTVAVAFAAELASRGPRTLLVDADPYGGAVAQQLGIVDEMSGLLAAARLATAGTLAERFASVPRALGPSLDVVTGLPRPDRWSEVRAGAVDHLLETARRRAQVVVDTGFCLEQDPTSEFGTRPGRNTLTVGALQVADEVVVVGRADPVGLSRLARGLVELRELLGRAPVHVVVNRSRSGLGWSEAEIAGMVEGFARAASLHFLPEDAAVDRAQVAGRTLVEMGDSPVGRAVSGLVDAVLPDLARQRAGGRSLRRRTAGRAHRR